MRFQDAFNQLRQKLRYTQRELARATRISKATATRLAYGYRPPSEKHLRVIVQFAASHDLALAKAMAESRGSSLEALGVKTQAAAATPAAPSPAAASALTDAVLYAGASKLDAPARDLLPVLRAVLARMRELGVGAEQMERAIAEPAKGKTSASSTKS